MRRFAPILTIVFVLFAGVTVSGMSCTEHLPPQTVEQERVADLTDYERLQIIVETVVTNPNTPADLKNALKALELQATDAVLAHDEAKAGGLSGSVIDFKLQAAVAALTALQQYLIEKGYGA